MVGALGRAKQPVDFQKCAYNNNMILALLGQHVLGLPRSY